MADFVYAFQSSDLYGTIPFRVCRAAALMPITGQPKSPVSPASIVQLYAQLQKLWRLRLVALRDAGWKVLSEAESNMRLQYFRNCPPCGVLPLRKARICNRSRVCPNCYMRNIVLETWLSLTCAARQLRDHGNTEDFRLIGFRIVAANRRLDAAPWYNGDSDSIYAAAYKTRADPLRFLEKTSAINAGTRLHFLVEPARTEGLINFIRSGIVIVDRPLGDALPAGCRQVSLNTASMASLISWAFRYPVGMLRGPVNTAAELLNNFTERSLPRTLTTGMLDNGSILAAMRLLKGNTNGRIKS